MKMLFFMILFPFVLIAQGNEDDKDLKVRFGFGTAEDKWGAVDSIVYVAIELTWGGWSEVRYSYMGTDHPIRGNEFWIEHCRMSKRYSWDCDVMWDESLEFQGLDAREKFMEGRNMWIRDYPNRKKEIIDAFNKFWSYFLITGEGVSHTEKTPSELMAGLLETNNAQMQDLISNYGEPDSISTSKWGSTIYHYLFPNGEKLLFQSGSKDSRVKEVEWFSEIVKDLDALQEKFKKYLVGQDFKMMNPTAITFQKVVNLRSRSVNVMVQKSFMHLWDEDYYGKDPSPDIIYILISF